MAEFTTAAANELIKFWKLFCKSLKALELPLEVIVMLSVVMVSVAPVVEPGAVLVVETGVVPVVELGAVLGVDAGVVLVVELGAVLVVEAGVVLVVVPGVVVPGAAAELAADNCWIRFCKFDTRFELLLRPLPLPPPLSPSESVLPLLELEAPA